MSEFLICTGWGLIGSGAFLAVLFFIYINEEKLD